MSEKTTSNFIRKSSLRIQKETKELTSFYNDIQHDYKKFFEQFFLQSGIGYGLVDQQGNISYVEPSETTNKTMTTFLNCIKSKDGSSNYSLFYDGYKPTGKAKLTNTRKKLFEKAHTLPDKKLKQSKGNGTPEFIRQWNTRILKDGWNACENELALALYNPAREAGTALRSIMNDRCRRPNNKNYCYILMEMISRSLRGIWEKYDHHMKETAELTTKAENQKNNTSTLLWELCQEVKNTEGFSEWVVKKLFKYRETEITCPQLNTAIRLRDSAKYAPLLTVDYYQIEKAYKYVKDMLKLERRKKYPLKPNLSRDVGVPIGLTGLGNFTMNIKEKGNAEFKFPFLETTVCTDRSHYFHGLNAAPVFRTPKKDKKTPLSGYKISFRHKLKAKRDSVGKEINGVMKELQLQRNTNDRMYVKISYTISHPIQNEKIAWFFRTADANSKKLPNFIKMAAFDLNIVNPACGCKAAAKKGDYNGPIQVLDYGSAQLIDQPHTLIKAGNHNSDLITLREDSKMVREAIRAYRNQLHKNIPIPEHLMARIEIAPLTQSTRKHLELKPEQLVRRGIEALFANVRKRFRQAMFEMRATGYANLADSIRLIEALDNVRSMESAMHRIHLKPNEQLHAVKKYDIQRQELKKHTMRRIAKVIADYAQDCNVVFIENLESEFDKDKNNNGLTRLFSPKMLLDAIEMALNKIGVQMVLVDKRGTSKTDPLTGLLGYRDPNNKEKLCVERNGVLGYIHSDNAASLNVLLNGANHSVCPYKFYVKINEKENAEDVSVGKRLTKFLKEQYNYKGKPKFIKDKDDNIVLSARAKKDRIGGYFYYRQGKFLTFEEHLKSLNELEEKLTVKTKEDNKIKVHVKFDVANHEFELIPEGTETYKNFRVERCLTN